MKRAESPYDRIVDMPTSTSEKLIKMGDRVTLWRVSFSHRTRTHVISLDLPTRLDVQRPDDPVQDADNDQGKDEC
jgi:hypothetical protein